MRKSPRNGNRDVLRTLYRSAFLTIIGMCLYAPIALAVQQRPVLQIDIPTVSFSNFDPPADATTPDALIGVPWISEYISGVYSYAISIAGLLAGVVFVIGGFQYLTAGGDSSRVSKAKERIKDALIGLFLTFGSFIILVTINPELVSLRAVNLKRVAPEVFILEDTGTGHPTTSDPANAQVNSYSIPAPDSPPPGGGGGTGGSSGSSGGAPSGGSTTPPPPSASGPPGASGASAPANIPPELQATTSGIVYEPNLGGTGNLLKYCTKASTFESATYEQKQQYLAKAVLGFIEVCVTRGKCAYAQGGYTPLPNGPAAGAWLPNFSVKALAGHGHPPEEVFSGNQDCIDRWFKRGQYEGNPASGPNLTNLSGACIAASNASMRANYLGPLNENKFFAGDCGTTVRQILRCGGVNMAKNDIPTKYKGKATGYPSVLNIDQHDGDPRMIISAYQKENLDAEAAKKGGMKFGDMVYMCCDGDAGSYSAHWMMYIGGRPEIPYSFIEMGGNPGASTSARSGSPNIPGWGQTGGVVLKKPGLSLEQFIRPKFSPQPPTWCRPGTKGCPTTIPPKKGVNNGLIFVWRPIPDAGGSAPTP